MLSLFSLLPLSQSWQVTQWQGGAGRLSHQRWVKQTQRGGKTHARLWFYANNRNWLKGREKDNKCPCTAVVSLSPETWELGHVVSSESIQVTLILTCLSQIPLDGEGSGAFWEPLVSRDHHCGNKESSTEEVAHARSYTFHTSQEADAGGQRDAWPEQNLDVSVKNHPDMRNWPGTWTHPFPRWQKKEKKTVKELKCPRSGQK